MTTPEYPPTEPSSPLPELATGLTDLRALARGGYSTVYRAWQESVGREVALKVDHRTLDDERDRRRFLREAQAAGRMSGHPHIVHVYDAGVTPDNHPYMVMELCTGGSYAAKLKAQERLTPEHVRDVGVKIADALDAAHRAGILHRDVKPANILINRYGVPGLADFGLASVHEASSRDTSVTVESLTPAYAAPEVFRMERPSAAGDIYSLGATLYALLAGRPPRWPERGSLSPVQVVELHNQPLPRLPQIPEPLYRVLAKAMASDPADRYESAAAFREALMGVDLDAPEQPVRQEPASAPLSPPAARTFAERVAAENPVTAGATEKLGRSRRALVLFGVLLGVLISIVAIGTFVTLHRLDSNSKPTHAECPIRTKQASCATKPQCFSQAGRDDSGFGASVPADCDTPHNWETFAVASIPVAIASPGYEQLRNDPYVVTMCSKETLSRLIPDSQSWKISLLPPTHAEATAGQDTKFRCVAGKSQPSQGSVFNHG